MSRASAWLRAGAWLAACWVSSAPAQQPGEQLQEVTVTGERAGPGLWHVYQESGTGQLWILASVSPLPKEMTWRSKQLETLLDSTNEVLLAKPVEIGIARAAWLLMTQRSLLMAGKNKKLRDVLPPELYARFSRQRARFTDDAAKWEKFRPIIAAGLLEEEALHRVGLSTRLDLGEEVRSLAHKHHVRIEEFKVAGVRDVLEALKTLTPGIENKCVAASLVTLESGLPRLMERAKAWATGDVERIQNLPEAAEVAACRSAITADSTPGKLYESLRLAWLQNMQHHLQQGGVTLAVVSMDMLIEPGGFLEQLRAGGYRIQAP